MTGLEVAEILSKDCAGMTMIDMVDVGPGLIHEILDEMMKILVPRGVKFLPYHKLVSVNEHGLTAQRLSDGADVTIDANIVVLSLGVTPDKKLIEQFKARFEQVYGLKTVQLDEEDIWMTAHIVCRSYETLRPTARSLVRHSRLYSQQLIARDAAHYLAPQGDARRSVR